MRSDSMTEVDVADDRPCWQIDDQHLVSIDTRLSHTGAAIDGHKCSAPIRGSGNFMSVNPDCLLWNGRNLSRGNRVNDAHIDVGLIDYEQCLTGDTHGEQSKTETWQQQILEDELSHRPRSIVHRRIWLHHSCYSYRRASMGSRREARTAGTIPLTSPTAARMSVATISVLGAMTRRMSPASPFFAIALYRVSLPTENATP